MNILISTGGGDPANYLQAVACAGGHGQGVYLPQSGAGYQGLILAGGGDIDPEVYGQSNAGSRSIDRARDRAELALLDEFLGSGRPVLGICRGHQLANVWAGGDLVQQLPQGQCPLHQAEAGDVRHSIRMAEGSVLGRLYGACGVVNSNHHQGLGRLGDALRVTAWSSDGVAEGLEHLHLPLWTVQFHPERMQGEWCMGDTVDGGQIFGWFIRKCEAVANSSDGPERRAKPRTGKARPGLP